MPSEKYSGSRLASIRHTTLTGPPAVTKSNSRSIFSSTSSIAASTSVPISGTAMLRARYRSTNANAEHLFVHSGTMIWPQSEPTW